MDYWATSSSYQVDGVSHTRDKSRAMVNTISQDIARDYPDYLMLANLLNVAKDTWRLFGISAGELSELDDTTLEMIALITGGNSG